jgi:hypothetical protein
MKTAADILISQLASSLKERCAQIVGEYVRDHFEF